VWSGWVMGTMATIKIPVEDFASLSAYLARPARAPASVGVIVAHELFGVNPDIRGVADDLAGTPHFGREGGMTPGAGSWSCLRPSRA
jgi:hypothetical protein